MKRKILSIIHLCLFASISNCFSQNQATIDSLNLVLQEEKHDTEKVFILCDIAAAYTDNNADTAEIISNKALNLAEKINFQLGIAWACNNLGTINWRKGNYEEALNYHKQCRQIKDELGDKHGASGSLTNMGMVYEAMGKYDKAAEHHLQALKLKQELNDTLGMTSVYSNLGIVYAIQDKFPKALEYFLKSLELNEQINRKIGIARSCGNIGLVYQYQKNYELSAKYHERAAKLLNELNNNVASGLSYMDIGSLHYYQKDFSTSLHFFKKAEKLLAETKYIEGIIKINLNLGSCYSELDNLDSALYHLTKAYNLAKSINHPQQIAEVGLSLGYIYRKAGNNTAAIKILKETELIAKQLADLDVLSNAYKELAFTYKKLGLIDSAFTYYEQFSQYNDSIYGKENAKKIAELEAKYQTEKKDKEIALLGKENEIKKLAINHYQYRIYIICGGTIALIIILVLLFNRHQLKESENFNKKLLVERQSRTKAIIEAQEDERKRIAKDLHDGIGQVLTSAKLSLQNTQGNNDNSVDESLAMIDTACEQVRRISHNMMPRVLEQNGLIPAIEGLLNSTLGNAAIEFDFEHFEVKKKYEPKIELGIFRIGQELIQNIIKHADANKVNIQLYQNKKQLVLMVEDTGKGFSTEEKSMGMGLASIITRAESLNGEANIESELNQFTRVTVRIPII